MPTITYVRGAIPSAGGANCMALNCSTAMSENVRICPPRKRFWLLCVPRAFLPVSVSTDTNASLMEQACVAKRRPLSLQKKILNSQNGKSSA
jgi:hypothetical protein